MALTITDRFIKSDEVGTFAEFRPHASADGQGAWVVCGSARGGRLFDRNQAVTAMTIAEELARPNPDLQLIESLESELAQ